MFGYAVFGTLWRTLALGLQRRPLFERPILLIPFIAGSMACGYALRGVEDEQLDRIERMRDMLVKRRMEREAKQNAD